MSGTTNNKHIEADYCFAFLGHPELDSRVMNFTSSLEKKGKSVIVIGFDWFGKGKINPRLQDNFILFPLKRRPSVLFYFNFIKNLRTALSSVKAKVYVAEDVYTLPFVRSVAEKNNAAVYYDSREIYNFIGGLAKKPLSQKIIAKLEASNIGKVDSIIVTGEMDKRFLSDYYSIPPEKFTVIRNLPAVKKINPKIEFRKKLNLPENAVLLVYQGIISKGRGLEKILKAISKLENAYFLVIGDGPLRADLENLSSKLNLETKVFFTGMIPNRELLDYTAVADIGVALIENISKSYYLALPNKLFEYFAAGIPVLASPLPQMEQIIGQYGAGLSVNPENINEIAVAIKNLSEDKQRYAKLKSQAELAAKELNWDKEFDKASNLF